MPGVNVASTIYEIYSVVSEAVEVIEKAATIGDESVARLVSCAKFNRYGIYEGALPSMTKKRNALQNNSVSGDKFDETAAFTAIGASFCAFDSSWLRAGAKRRCLCGDTSGKSCAECLTSCLTSTRRVR